MATDDLAAEIAAHVACTGGACRFSHACHCLRCEEPWPCLVRRLADDLAASEAGWAREQDGWLKAADQVTEVECPGCAHQLVVICLNHDPGAVAVMMHAPAAEPDAGGVRDG